MSVAGESVCGVFRAWSNGDAGSIPRMSCPIIMASLTPLKPLCRCVRRYALIGLICAVAGGVKTAQAETPPARAEPPPAPAPAPVPPAVVEALKQVDEALAEFERRMVQESSAVNKAAMKTRLVVLTQRRIDLEESFSPERHAALLEELKREVKVTAKAAATRDPDGGRARRSVKLEETPKSAVETYQAEAQEARRRAEQAQAERMAEETSRRRLEVARINTDLSRLSAQIDSVTVGEGARRAELNLRLRELEQERARLESAPHPSGFDHLRLEIQRELERTRRP